MTMITLNSSDMMTSILSNKTQKHPMAIRQLRFLLRLKHSSRHMN
jgi:hypothetical protein